MPSARHDLGHPETGGAGTTSRGVEVSDHMQYLQGGLSGASGGRDILHPRAITSEADPRRSPRPFSMRDRAMESWPYAVFGGVPPLLARPPILTDCATPTPSSVANVTATAGICMLKSTAEWQPTRTDAPIPVQA